MNWRWLTAGLVLGAAGLWFLPAARACPFCSAVSQTLSERIKTSDLAVLAELVDSPPTSSDAAQPLSNEAVEAAKSTFRVLKVYRGQQFIRPGDTFKALYFGKKPPGTKCLATGLEPTAIQWGLPQELSPRAIDYIEQSAKLPPRGPDRLHFFDPYLEDAETVLQDDAANEFAQADYAALTELHGRLNHNRLLSWIQNPAVPETRRRLYFILLGICDQPQDVPLLEAMIRSGDATQMRGLDALLACYLTLDGTRGLPLVEDLFLKKKDADYTQTYAAIMAIRFHVQQGDVIPRARGVVALRYMLDRPQLADLVIPDLARWEDWDSVDRLATLFKESTKEWSYIRVPIINFLKACPRPEAKAKLEELAKLDPESFRRAATYFPFGGSALLGRKPAVKKAAPQPASGAKPAATPPRGAAALRPVAGAKQAKVAVAAKGPGQAPAAPTAAAAKPIQSARTPVITAAGASIAQLPVAARPRQAAGLVAAAGPRAEESGPKISAFWLKMCVTWVPVGGAAVLMLAMWMILRSPTQRRLDRSS